MSCPSERLRFLRQDLRAINHSLAVGQMTKRMSDSLSCLPRDFVLINRKKVSETLDDESEDAR